MQRGSDTVETLMSPLALIQRTIARKQRLTDAQMTHLRAKAYRGVSYGEPRQLEAAHSRLTYRGISYDS